MKRKYYNILFFMLVLIAVILFSQKSLSMIKHVFSTHIRKEQVVVLDAGHGGFDPGKVGINGALEKDVNLSITFKVKKLLEQNDIHVVMTREDDNGLYSENDSNKKNADLRKRVQMIGDTKPLFAVSIHQNSFPQENQKGAQVFYHKKSEGGKALANILQKQLKDTLKDNNRREAKANDSYYMLKQTECPLVIVECGFLSNSQEAELLCNEEYQEKLAWAIHLGIMQYYSNYCVLKS